MLIYLISAVFLYDLRLLRLLCLLPQPPRTRGAASDTDFAVRGGISDLAGAWAALKPSLALSFPFELDTFQKEAVLHLEAGRSVRSLVIVLAAVTACCVLKLSTCIANRRPSGLLLCCWAAARDCALAVAARCWPVHVICLGVLS